MAIIESYINESNKDRRDIVNKVTKFFNNRLKSSDITVNAIGNSDFIKEKTDTITIHILSKEQLTITIVLYALGFYYISNRFQITQEKAKKYIDEAKDDLEKELSEYVGYKCEVSCPAKGSIEKYVIKVKVKTDAINESFLSKEDKKESHNRLMDLEDSYDKKYNGFCLAISKYSVDQLESMLDKKNSELKEAKDDLKNAHEKDAKLELKLKIDYLENVCNRCKVQIKKKKSYK